MPRFLSCPTTSDSAASTAFTEEARSSRVSRVLAKEPGEELVHAPQDRSEGASGKALVLLVDQAEGDEVRRLELEGVVDLAAARLFVAEPSVHANHLEGALLQVVGLLGVQCQDLVGHVRVGNDDGRGPLRLELPQDRQAVVAVGCPVDAGLRRDDDDGIHETIDLPDHLLEALGVGGREVALVGRRRDGIGREEGEDVPMVPHRLAIDREGVAAVGLDPLGEGRHGPRRIAVGERREPRRHPSPPITPRPASRAAAPSPPAVRSFGVAGPRPRARHQILRSDGPQRSSG